MMYRREIDGLRAVAVVPVMLFHAGLGAFSGGYVGVDVFFVISGYLITSLLVADLGQGRLSLVDFYERRARRILPALFTVMLVSLLLAWLLLWPRDMADFAKSLIAVPLFLSNILFWQQTGYFETAAELKPLLHTWSLAVEEQYYLLFPGIFAMLWRCGRRILLMVLGGLFAVSMALSHWAVLTHPAPAFFLLPSRGWELLIGVFCALRPSAAAGTVTGAGVIVRELLGWLGLVLILGAVFCYDKSVPFPGLYALVPTIGTALIILFASPSTVVGRLLGSRPLVGMGLISYSAYLWHQPLFAFGRQRGLGAHDTPWFLALAVLATVLAVLTWRLVEQPARDRTRLGRRAIFLFALLGTVFFVTAGATVLSKRGYVGQFTPEQERFVRYFDNEIPEMRYLAREGLIEKLVTDCNFFDISAARRGKPSNMPVRIADSCHDSTAGSDRLVLLWGNSHAQHLAYGLRQHLPGGYVLLQITSSGCLPVLHAVDSPTDYCAHANATAMQTIRRLRPAVVIIAQDLGHDAATMAEMARVLHDLGVKRTVFPGPVPHWSPSLPAVVALRLLPDVPHYATVGLDSGLLAEDRRLKRETAQMNQVVYVSLMDYFCGPQGCLVYSGESVTEGITTYDGAHLTARTSSRLARDLLVRRILEAGP